VVAVSKRHQCHAPVTIIIVLASHSRVLLPDGEALLRPRRRNDIFYGDRYKVEDDLARFGELLASTAISAASLNVPSRNCGEFRGEQILRAAQSKGGGFQTSMYAGTSGT